MLQVALSDEDYALAASLRDGREQVLQQSPTYLLRGEMAAAVCRQDFLVAAGLRDEISRMEMLDVAERCKPKYPLGLVVRHKRLGYRMVLFGADFTCRAPRRRMEDVGVCFCQRGHLQPWYHAAVDERDKRGGDNVVYVAEDDCVPAEFGTEVRHPITRIMFRGVYSRKFCPGYSWYVSVSAGNFTEGKVEHIAQSIA